MRSSKIPTIAVAPGQGHCFGSEFRGLLRGFCCCLLIGFVLEVWFLSLRVIEAFLLVQLQRMSGVESIAEFAADETGHFVGVNLGSSRNALGWSLGQLDMLRI